MTKLYKGNRYLDSRGYSFETKEEAVLSTVLHDVYNKLISPDLALAILEEELWFKHLDDI